MMGTTHRGFALNDMVILSLVLGVVATVAGTTIVQHARQPGINSTRHDLAVLRNAIETYRSQNGAYPGQGDLADAMAAILGEPLPPPAIGPVRGLSAVYYDPTTDSAPVLPDPDAQCGWAYKPSNGSLKLNLDPTGTDIGKDW